MTDQCLFCFGDASAPDHAAQCDARQRAIKTLSEALSIPQIVADADPREGTIAERAERFHARNPNVYQFAVSVARDVKRRGLKHYGIGAVWEIMRYKYLETHGDIYKLNDHHRAWYARRMMALEPDLDGFFVTRDCPNDPEYRTRPVRP